MTTRAGTGAARVANGDRIGTEVHLIWSHRQPETPRRVRCSDEDQMRTTARQRRQVSQAKLWWLRPVVRYSYKRDAYVLRGVGRHVGPVYQLADNAPLQHATLAQGSSPPDITSPGVD
jgi:hypothetical protein